MRFASNQRIRTWLVALVLLGLSSSAGRVWGQSWQEVAREIDRYIEARLIDKGLAAAPPCDDATFLRRVTLDLAGRIPTRAEAQQFLADAAPDKRQTAVTRLSNSHDFSFHLRNELDLHLLGRLKHDGPFRAYLLEATRQNRGWEQMVRELLLPDRVPVEPSPVAFLRERARELDDLANDSSSLLFGVNISCAKCHDHPLVSDWKQDHFYGMTAFFQRTYLTKKNLIAEKFEGLPKFQTVDGVDKTAQFMFLNGTVVAEPAVERTEEQKKADDQEVQRQQKQDDAGTPRLPDFSPRAELVRLVMESDGGRLLAAAMVNRTWARLLGHGLVEPLDQMHSENPASHPELLEYLARDFIEHGYDLRRLHAAITSSAAYARSSRWPGEPPGGDQFAVAVARPLTPRQLALSLALATSAGAAVPDSASAEWGPRREQWESQADGLASQFEVPGEYFEVGVDEALLFNNAERIDRELLSPQKDRLVGELLSMQEEEALVNGAFWSVLGRAAEPAESAACREYLAARTERREQGLQQIVWALLTGPEFRFNH